MASRGTLVMSGHIFGCHIWRQVTDIERGEAGDAGTHPTTPTPVAEKYLLQDINGVERLRKPARNPAPSGLSDRMHSISGEW